MSEAIQFTLNNAALNAAFDRIGRVGNVATLMPSLAAELHAQTELNFENEGRPKWAELAKSTIAKREKNRTWPGKILQVTGGLARAVISETGAHYAAIGVAGTHHPYAAIQQLGGEAGRNYAAKIVARPYLPMLPDGSVQPEAADGLLNVVYVWVNARMQ